MAERRKARGTGQAERPPLTAEQFEATPEFRKFRSFMKKLLKVNKAELDRRLAETKARKGL